MHEFDVRPLDGAGPVRLGMTRAESRAAMGLPVRPYRKGGAESRLTDAYLDSAFQVFFDEADRVEFIELSHGGDVVALFRGARVFDLPAAEMVELVSREAAADEDDPEHGTSYTFPALALSLWRPFEPEEEEDEEDWSDFDGEIIEPEAGQYDGSTFATIGVARPGYFGAAGG